MQLDKRSKLVKSSPDYNMYHVIEVQIAQNVGVYWQHIDKGCIARRRIVTPTIQEWHDMHDIEVYWLIFPDCNSVSFFFPADREDLAMLFKLTWG